MFESGRAHLLMAKCLVASNNNINSQHSNRRRLSVLESSKHLKKAETCFRAAGDGQRVKDVLYMAVRIRKLQNCSMHVWTSDFFRRVSTTPWGW